MFTKKAKQNRQAEKLQAAQEELREACSRTSDTQFQTVQRILQQYPDSVKVINENGNLALHLACFNGAPLQVVELLVANYPESLRIPDKHGSLAIHWACYGTSPLIVIQNLLLQYPESISVKTNNGQIPLHYACHDAGRLDVVKVLCEKFREGVHEKNEHGMLPLHIACASPRADLKVVEYLVDQDTSTVFAESSTGEIPVDHAGSSGASPLVIQYLDGIMEYLRNQNNSAALVAPSPNGMSSNRSLGECRCVEMNLIYTFWSAPVIVLTDILFTFISNYVVPSSPASRRTTDKECRIANCSCPFHH
jgi:ankyrin repeat protein